MADEYELREMIGEVQRGRQSRRQFVRQMVALGLTAPFANMMLNACGGGAAAPIRPAPTTAPAPAAAAAPTAIAQAGSSLAAASPAAASSGGLARTRRGGDGTLKLLWWQAPSHANAHLSTGTKDFDSSRLF